MSKISFAFDNTSAAYGWYGQAVRGQASKAVFQPAVMPVQGSHGVPGTLRMSIPCQDLPNMLTYQRAVETEKAGYLIRQWLTNNLYNRISTRPFLSLTKKKWIAFQLLTAMANSWNRGVTHGDLKSENVIVTSWNWVYITDFSPTFKPTYLPQDDPADFSYYFDTSSRRSCYLAPERFYSAKADIGVTSKAKVSESMDVFGLGCVIGELFTKGSSSFTLSQMFNCKFGDYSVKPYLRGIEDEKIRDLVRSMIQLDPRDRLTFKEYLKNCTGPSIGGGSRLADLSPHSKLRNDADGIVEKLWSDFEYVSGFMGGPHKLKVQSKVSEGSGETPSPHPDTKVNQSDGAGSEPLRHSWADFPLRINVPGRNVCLRSTSGLPRSSVDVVHGIVKQVLTALLHDQDHACGTQPMATLDHTQDQERDLTAPRESGLAHPPTLEFHQSLLFSSS
ncbi:hypothetical protein PCASD_13376 [Puccinia coronata f. sp. avenae]|uniref:Protein kinase domain-containing protein n=1 Tax=Puccinia coronata f. sp. avenae TaxID=200324 RepID=A0A2N5TZC1_9BASI|nr:hypothetical protein PCASD_13376 [Puccinia coronata f. sp. avenae]